MEKIKRINWLMIAGIIFSIIVNVLIIKISWWLFITLSIIFLVLIKIWIKNSFIFYSKRKDIL